MKTKSLAEDLLGRYQLISDQVTGDEVSLILNELDRALSGKVRGDIVEFGCYTGTTSLFITRLLKARNDQRRLHVYDSFEGLPEKTQPDRSIAGEHFKAGELSASRSDLITYFKKAGLKVPKIHKLWFSDLKAEDIPNQIAFAFLDGDYYLSIKQPLDLIADRLSKGAVIVIDDYMNEQLPGAQLAVDEWRESNGEIIASFRVQQSLAIIRLK